MGQNFGFASESRRPAEKLEKVIRCLERAVKRLVKSESRKDPGKDPKNGGQICAQLTVFENMTLDLDIVTIS
jgi:hypothetical protein